MSQLVRKYDGNKYVFRCDIFEGSRFVAQFCAYFVGLPEITARNFGLQTLKSYQYEFFRFIKALDTFRADGFLKVREDYSPDSLPFETWDED